LKKSKTNLAFRGRYTTWSNYIKVKGTICEGKVINWVIIVQFNQIFLLRII